MTTITRPTATTPMNWKNALVGITAAAALIASTMLVVGLVDDSTEPGTTPVSVVTEPAVPRHIQDLEARTSFAVAAAASMVPAHIRDLEARTSPAAPSESGNPTGLIPTHILDLERTIGE